MKFNLEHIISTDIPLLPSISSMSLGETEEKNGPFVVHWLNNKELHFSLSMEVFLQQLKKSFDPQSSEASTDETNQVEGNSDEGLYVMHSGLLNILLP